MINYNNLIWESECDGSDLGLPNISIIGIYSYKDNSDERIYIDIENNTIIERRNIFGNQ